MFFNLNPSKVTCITAHALESRGVLKTPHCISPKETDDFHIKNISIQIGVGVLAYLYKSNRHSIYDFQVKGGRIFK